MRTIYTMKVRLQIYVMLKIKPFVFRYHCIKQNTTAGQALSLHSHGKGKIPPETGHE
jgi:hypothetical protein